MHRNIEISKETLDRIKLAKKYIEGRYTKIIQKEVRDTENWRKVISSMEKQNLNKKHQIDITDSICKQQTINKRIKREKDSLSNYQLFSIVGRGAFGQVRLAKNISTNEILAIKRLQKKRLVKKKQLYTAYLERDFLIESNSSFLIQLKSSFQDSQYLYIVMEYAPGGDFLRLLIERDIFTEQQTKFYIAQLVAAVEEIHNMNYIHRDIKPDNILLDQFGHIKISDFGLGKYLQKKRSDRPTLTKKQKLHKHMILKNRQTKMFSKVGTPDYISPQVLTSSTYDHSVDIWGIGVLMFECLFGYPPFSDNQPKGVCYKVINWKQHLEIPSNSQCISQSARNLLFGLINDQDKRLKIQEIKSHPYFKKIDWKNLRSMKPPFIPHLNNEIDVKNFDSFEVQDPWTAEEQVRKIGHVRNKSSSLELNFKFAGFDYKRLKNDPLEEIRRDFEELTNKSKGFVREKKRLKTQQCAKRDDKFRRKTNISFMKHQHQNMMKGKKQYRKKTSNSKSGKEKYKDNFFLPLSFL